MKKILVSVLVCALFFVSVSSVKAYSLNDVMIQIKSLQEKVTNLQNLTAQVIQAVLVDQPQDQVKEQPQDQSLVETSKSLKRSCGSTDHWVQVLSPNGGEVYNPGQAISVTWTSCNIPSTYPTAITLFDVNSGGAAPVYLSSTTPNDGQENVTLPYVVGTFYKIQVLPQGVYNDYDWTDGLFTIVGTQGNIKITKDTIPDNYQDFTFTHNIPGYGSFVLDDDGTLPRVSSSTTISNAKSLVLPAGGSFSLYENPTPEYITSADCTDPSGGTHVTLAINGHYPIVNIPMVYGQSISCLFTNKKTYTLTYTAGAHGSITGTSPQTVAYGDNGSTVTAVPAPCYSFVNWSDGSTANPRTDLNVTHNIAVTANFAVKNYTLTYTAGTGGTITGTSPQTVACGANGSTVTAVPNAGYTFLNWSGNLATSTVNPRTDSNVTQNISMTANFIITPCTSNTWTQKADVGGVGGRISATGFSIGSKGYIGTGVNNGYYKDFWEYNPATNIWTQKADFGGVGRSDTIEFSIGAKGYIGTGNSGSGYLRDFWEYNPATNIWTQKANFGGVELPTAVSFSIGSKGYIGTGSLSYSYGTPDFWEYDPATNIWTPKANFLGDGRADATGFSVGNKGYIGTGRNTTNLKDFWEYNLATNAWTQKANFGGTARVGAVGFSIGTKGYIGTGRNTTNLKDFWEYNPATNGWTQKANFGGTERVGAVGFSIGTKGYIGTGYKNNLTYKDFWEYCP